MVRRRDKSTADNRQSRASVIWANFRWANGRTHAGSALALRLARLGVAEQSERLVLPVQSKAEMPTIKRKFGRYLLTVEKSACADAQALPFLLDVQFPSR